MNLDDYGRQVMSELYQKHHRLLLRIARVKAKNAEDAMDLVHDVICIASEKVNELPQDLGRQFGWLCAALEYRAKQLWDRQSYSTTKIDSNGNKVKQKVYAQIDYLEEGMLDDALVYDDQSFIFRDELEGLFRNLLTTHEKRYVILRYMQDMRIAEIAMQLHMSESAVTSLGNRVRKKLMDSLNKP